LWKGAGVVGRSVAFYHQRKESGVASIVRCWIGEKKKKGFGGDGRPELTIDRTRERGERGHLNLWEREGIGGILRGEGRPKFIRGAWGD